jgi:hypothetical protein
MACGVSEHDCDCGGERTVVQRDYLTVMARGRKTKTEKVSVTIPKAEWDKKRFGFYCVNIDSLGLRPFESFEFRCKVDAENSTEDVWELFFTDTLKDPLAVFRVNMGTGIISLDRVRSDVPLASCTSVFDDAYQVPEHTAHVFIGVPSGSGQYYPTTTSFRFIVGRVTNGTVRITDASWREIEHIEVVNSNPYTRSQRPERQRRYVVRGTISTYYVDHLWVWGFNRNYHWHVGKRVKFKGPLRKYLYDGVYKYKIGTPLRLLKF